MFVHFYFQWRFLFHIHLQYKYRRMNVMKSQENMTASNLKKDGKAFEQSNQSVISSIALPKTSNPFTQSSYKRNQVMPLQKAVSDGQKNETSSSSQTQCCQEFSILIKKINMSIWFRGIFFILLVMLLISCVLQTIISSPKVIECGENIEKYCLIGLGVLLIIEIINWKNHYKFWLILSFLSLSAGIAAFIVENDEAFRSLKTVRCLNLLLFLKLFENLDKQMKTFIHSWSKASKLLIAMLLIIYITAAINLFVFSTLEYKKCRDPINKERSSNWTIYEGEVFICGETRPCPVVGGVQYECLNPFDYGVEPNPEELESMTQGFGLLTFANIGSSILVTLKQIFITGSTKHITLYKATFLSEIVIFYFISFIYLIQGFSNLDPLFTQIFSMDSCCSKKIKKEKNRRSLEISSISQSQFSDKIENQSSFIFRQPILNKTPVIHFSAGGSQFRTMQEREKNANNIECKIEQKKPTNIFEEADEISIKTENQSNQPKNYIEGGDGYICYTNIRILFAFLCCINLSLEFEGQSKEFEYAKNCVQLSLYLLFLIELISLLIYKKCIRKEEIGMGFKFDIFIGLIYAGGLTYDALLSNSFEEFVYGDRIFSKICKSFIFLRIFSTFSSSSYGLRKQNKIIQIIPKSIFMVRHFIIAWLLIVAILSLMGFHLQNGRHNHSHENYYDRLNFEGIYPSIIFTLLTVFNEDWDTLMFKEYHQSGTILIVFWQFWVMIFGYIMFSKYLILLIATELDKLITENEGNSSKFDEQKNLSEYPQESVKINEVTPSTEEDKQNKEEKEQKRCFQGCYICCRRIRQIFTCFLEMKAFKVSKVIITLIICFILLVMHPQADPSCPIYLIAKNLNILSTSFYFCQCFARIISEGLWNSKRTLFGRVYFLIQVFILIVEILMFTPFSESSVFHQIVKIRVMRISYIIKFRYESDWNMKVLINSIKKLMVKNLQPLISCLLIYFFIGLIFTKIYKNDYNYCDNAFEFAQIITKQDCLNWGGDWVYHSLNLKNPFNGFRYVFLVSTMGGWITLMNQAMDINGEGMAPTLNANFHIQIFFMVLFFFGNMIVLNSLIGITLDSYKRIKENQTGENRLTQNDRVWLRVKLQILRLQPIEREKQPENCFRKYSFRFYHHKSYLLIKGSVFFLALVRMSLHNIIRQELFGQKYLWGYFYIIITLEIFINLLAFGFNKNLLYVICLIQFQFSFFAINFIQNQKIKNYLETIIMIIVIISFIQCNFLIILVLNRTPSLQKLFNPIAKIFPRTLNFFILLSTMLVTYTIGGMGLFSFVKFGKELDQYNQNYTNPLLAFYSVLKLSLTESSIQQILETSRQMAPNFVCNQIITYEDFLSLGQTGCGSFMKSNLFYSSFHLFYNIFLMSIFLAFIVDAYADVLREESSKVTKYLLKKAQKIWSEKDPEATGMISYREFWVLTKQLIDLFEEGNEKISKQNLVKEKESFLKKLYLTVYEDHNRKLCFEFTQFLSQITKLYLEKNMNCKLEDEKVSSIAYQWVQKKIIPGLRKTKFKSSDVHSLILLKSALKSWKNKANENSLVLPLTKLLTGKKKGKIVFTD